MAKPWEKYQNLKPWERFASEVPSRTTEGMGLLERTGELTRTGIRQGLADIGGIPRALAESAAAPATPGEKARTVRGSISPEQRQQRLAASEAEKQRIGQFAQANLPSSIEMRRQSALSTGIPETLPTEASGRILQAGARGTTAGAVFGPGAALYGGIAAGGGQTARELGAPEPVARAVEFAAPLGAAAGLSRALRPRPSMPPDSEQLRAMADNMYETARQSGVLTTTPAMTRLADSIRSKAIREGIDPSLHPGATAALNRVEDFARTPQTLQQIDTLRRILRDAASSNSAGERRIAQKMTSKLDDWFENLKPSDVIAGDVSLAKASIAKARDLWTRFRKSETVEDAIYRGRNNASASGSGGNIDNAIRQQIKGIINHPRRSRGFSASELEIMQQVVDGKPIQNLMRLVGKLSPGGNGLMTALGFGSVLTGASTGNFGMVASTVAAQTAGVVAKAIADGATRRNVESLLRAIRAGTEAQKRLPMQPLPLRNVGLGIAGQSLTGPLQ